MVAILLAAIVSNTITASSRDDLMQAINIGDFPLAVKMLNNTIWQYEENDENILDWDRYTQFFSYCVSNNIGKDTMDIVSNYVVQLSIQIGNLHKTDGNLDKAEQWFYSAVDLSESLSMPKYAIQKSISYNQLGNFYQEKTTKYDLAVYCYELADSNWRANNTSANDSYWVIIQNKADACELAAQSYRNNEDWQSARYYYAYEAFELRRLNGDMDAQYALALNREAIMASNLKDYTAADSLLTISRRILETPNVDKDSSYTYVWGNLMQNYFNLQNYKQITEECNKIENNKSSNKPYVEEQTLMYWKVIALCNIALQKELEGQYDKAEQLLVQANQIDIERKKKNAADTGFGDISDMLVRVRYEKEDGLQIAKGASVIDELNFVLKQGHTDTTVIFYLLQAAHYFINTNNSEEAYNCYKRVYDMLQEYPALWDEMDEKSRNAYYINILSLYYPYAPAIFTQFDIEKGAAYMAQTYGVKSVLFYTYQLSLASYYLYYGNPSKAKSTYSKIIDEITALYLQRKIRKVEDDDYRKILLAATIFLSGYYEHEEHNKEKAWQILDKVLHEKYATAMLNIELFNSWISLCYDLKKFDKIWDVIPMYYSLTEDRVNNVMDVLTSDEQIYWYHKSMPFFYDGTIMLATNYVDDVPGITIDAICNHEIFKKGILLRASENITKYIGQSGDAAANQLYNEIIAQKKQLLNLQEQQHFSDSILTNLQYSIDSKERLLSSLSGNYVRRQKEDNITWKDIQAKLKSNEVAIEFANYGMVDQYWAFVIRKGYKHPKLVYLKDFINESESRKQLEISTWKQFASIKPIGSTISIPPPEFLEFTGNANMVYKVGGNGSKLYELLWKPLRAYINEGETIYFSPSGVLHQVAIESLPYDSVSTMSDHFNMVRLSSTREIVLRNNNEHKESATIYGGIQYDVDTTELLAESRQYEQTTLLASRGMENDTTDRGSVKYLWGTKKEAESIDRLLAKHNVSATLYTSTAANEESFKALSGKHQNIIHIGTHGFYWADSTAHKQDFFMQRSMSMGDDLPMQYAIDPLDRCGLLFAGANMALSGHSRDLPEGVQDGILTAKEISLMDLRDCDLVVLSACETAKGDITSEGVFGLQRAFKVAGVQTIIMSLWKVDDNATQMLMTEFYTNWIEKKQSKREAFKNAQNAVRFAVDKYGDRMYADPVYWAGFIMLD